MCVCVCVCVCVPKTNTIFKLTILQFKKKEKYIGVPAVAQWVKNPATAPQVTVEAQAGSLTGAVG